MSGLKPDVKQMLEIGKDCGLSTLAEAYGHYMCHYDLFFLISNYSEQYGVFRDNLIDLGFVDTATMELIDVSIDSALKRVS